VTWLFTVLAVAVIALAAGVVTGRISGGMDPAPSSSPYRGLPPEGVVADDLDALRFTPALRGYRMDEVDQVLDQVGVELRRRDEEIARLGAALRGEPYPAEAAPGSDGDADAGHDAGLEGRAAGVDGAGAAAATPDAGTLFERPVPAPLDRDVDLDAAPGADPLSGQKQPGRF